MNRLLVVSGLVLSVGVHAWSQDVYLSDAIRFATPGTGVGARALGMGSAFTGVANDYSALYWNPAGLAQLEYNELSAGLSYLNYQDWSTYFDQSHYQAKNSATLNALGIAAPLPVSRGSFVLAFGYTRENNFATGMSLEHPNANSYIQSLAYDRDTVYEDEFRDNLAWRLYLADTLAGSGHWRRFPTNNGMTDSAYAFVWNSPIKNQITQIERVFEGGGLNNWTAGGAVDVAKNFSIGVSLIYQSGSYEYDGTYREVDDQNVYQSGNVSDPRNFHSFEAYDLVKSDISGFGAKFGFMFRDPDRFRLGVNIKTPVVFHVEEKYGTTYTSTPDFADVVTIGGPADFTNKYELLTPWVFSAGASLTLWRLVVAADVDYTDWTQMEFRDANEDILALNRQFNELFRATVNVRFGAELSFREQGLRFRGGAMYNQSPYQNDPAGRDQKYLTAGLGIPLGESVMLDLAYARGWWDTLRDNFDRSATIDEKVVTNTGLVTISVRF
jgi:long-subunit fatty acid transport protein